MKNFFAMLLIAVISCLGMTSCAFAAEVDETHVVSGYLFPSPELSTEKLTLATGVTVAHETPIVWSYDFQDPVISSFAIHSNNTFADLHRQFGLRVMFATRQNNLRSKQISSNKAPPLSWSHT